ncbi:phage tail terminator protein [Enterococcus sp. LJL128]
MDFYERTAEHLLNQLTLESVGENDLGEKEIIFRPLTNYEKGIAILDAPSETDIRFLDRSRSYNINFLVSVKNKDQQIARRDAFLIYQELDDLPRPAEDGNLQTILSGTNSFMLRTCEGVLLPQLQEVTEEDAFVYSLQAKANLFIKRN